MTKDPSSYRDPSGYIFYQEGKVYRQVNLSFQKEFEQLVSSGCYTEMVERKQLIPHHQIGTNLTGDNEWYTTLAPLPIPFISFSWEWSFNMLKDAALLTLDIHQTALKYGLSLKDAATHNIQFLEGKPVFIDSLSFEFYDESRPWIAYRQFCEQFLSPLLLMHYLKLPLQRMGLAFTEGIPLELTSKMLPFRSKLSLHCYLHIHLNARMSKKSMGKSGKSVHFDRTKMDNLIRSLRQLVNSLNLVESESTWSAYYEEASQRNNYLLDKKRIIDALVEKIAPEIKDAADLGANDGEFSRFFANKGINCLAADLDANCIDRLYRTISKENNPLLQPVIQDLSLPSPAIGVNNEERPSFLDRAGRDAVVALALIHHLAIGKNIPLDKIATMFAGLCKKWLIIEFVPKNDEKVQYMLREKKDIFSNYDHTVFESAFSRNFSLIDKIPVKDSFRTIYLFRKIISE